MIQTRVYAPAVISAPGIQEWLFVPHEQNTETARAVLARPQDYGFAVQRAACIWLQTHGDFMDRNAARMVLEVLDAEARKAMLTAGAIRARQNWLWPVLRVFGYGLAAGLVALWLLHIGQKAYGQYQYDTARIAQVAGVQE